MAAKTKALTVRRRRSFFRRTRTGSRETGGLSLAIVGGLLPTILDSWNFGQTRASEPGGVMAGMGHQLLLNFTGFNSDDHKWYPSTLLPTYGYLLLGVMIHKLANRFGINRGIRRMGIPFISI